MSASGRRLGVASLGVLLTLLLATPAGAFFPQGGYNLFSQLRIATWPLNDFDTNNDGNVTVGEGLPILIEGGKSGFTPQEIAIVKAAFQVWGDVPTSYASFRFTGIIQDPIADETDYLPMVSLHVAADDGENIVADPAETAVADLTFPLLSVPLMLYAIEDTPIEAADTQVIVPAGNVLDCDIIVAADLVRTMQGEVEPVADLKAVLVHEIGAMLGLGATPLNNLRPLRTTPDADPEAWVENEVLWITGADGIQRFIGVTPTMFPTYFLVDDGLGNLRGGWADLAPDDISGISSLYPRGDQSNFFNINQEARTHTRAGTGLPSVPISGAHIVAWADIDNNSATPRVPLFSTLSGLYEPAINEALVGKFSLKGLWKQLEEPGTTGARFNVSYALTMNPLNGTGLDRQAPEQATSDLFDSLQGPTSFSLTTQRSADQYMNYFPSEVFHEVENVYDVSNYDAGTPLIWDFSSDTVVSSDTQRTLPTILPRSRPMFGDPNDVCPLNVIQTGTGTAVSDVTGGGESAVSGYTDTATTGGSTISSSDIVVEWQVPVITFGSIFPHDGSGPGGGDPNNMLRAFRDGVLLKSALGTALVDVYYTLSPAMARFLLRHELALRAFRAAVGGLFWTLEHGMMVMSMVVFLAAVGMALRRRHRVRARVTALLLVGTLLLALPAGAGIAFITTSDMAANADAIVTGTVASVECRSAYAGRIYTDVVLEIADTAKGDLNKASYLSFSVIGGRIGTVVLKAGSVPSFTEGEEVLLYLRELPNHEYVVYGGQRGKFIIHTDVKTGKKHVSASSDVAKAALRQDATDLKEKASKEEKEEKESGATAEKAETTGARIPLDVYLDYLRRLIREQKRNAR